MICPLCGIENDDYWLVEVDGEFKEGGCQGCWEKQCDESWWKAIAALRSIEEENVSKKRT